MVHDAWSAEDEMATLVCDDHPLVRSALTMLAEAAFGPPVLTAADFFQAWAAAEANPDLQLCIVDLHMPGMSPIEGLAGVKLRAPAAKIVAVTGSTDDEELRGVLALGVHGYVSKTIEPGVVEAALRLVMAGGRYLPPRVAELANEAKAAPAPAAPQGREPTGEPADAPYGRLGPRQRDVLEQMAQGRSNKDIARVLGLSPATVKSHVAHVIAVLGAGNRTEAVSRARQHGLL